MSHESSLFFFLLLYKQEICHILKASNNLILNLHKKNPEKSQISYKFNVYSTVDLINDHLKEFNLCFYCKTVPAIVIRSQNHV